jgi:bacterioferritin-associated ferredoxin
MVVCVCKNINTNTILTEFDKGQTPKQVIKKFGCIECTKCNQYIHQMYKQK